MDKSSVFPRRAGDERTAWEGRQFAVVEVAHQYPDGSLRLHEVMTAPDVVRTYAVDGDRIAVIREFRHDVGERVLRVPAGRIGAGEDPSVAALRELEEETGLRAGSCSLLRRSQPVLKFRHQAWHYIATDLEQSSQRLELGEDVQLDWLRLADIEETVLSLAIPEDSIALSLLLIAKGRASTATR
jgi:8-oxo-dGTP pyrophosphatase MutT (NUDIX family)